MKIRRKVYLTFAIVIAVSWLDNPVALAEWACGTDKYGTQLSCDGDPPAKNGGGGGRSEPDEPIHVSPTPNPAPTPVPDPQAAERERKAAIRVEANKLNHSGLEALKRGDLLAARDSFYQAWQTDPSVDTFRKNYNIAISRIDSEERTRLMQRNISSIDDDIKRRGDYFDNPSPGGGGASHHNAGPSGPGKIDFGVNPKPAHDNGCPPTGSSSVVDACNVPSGLPKGIETNLAMLFGNAPEDVRMRVKKGWQAVMAHDWQLATASFKEALARDPGNPDLTRWLQIIKDPESSNQGSSFLDKKLDAEMERVWNSEANTIRFR